MVAYGSGSSVKRRKRVVVLGVVNIMATFNNVIINISDCHGNTLAWASGGSKGFKGTKKSAPHVAQIVADHVAKAVMERGMKTASVKIRGLGPGVDFAVKSLRAAGLSIIHLDDVTPVPHNGCRLRKRRKV